MVNEALCKLLAHNLCALIQEEHELGIESVFWPDTEKAMLIRNSASSANSGAKLPNMYNCIVKGCQASWQSSAIFARKP